MARYNDYFRDTHTQPNSVRRCFFARSAIRAPFDYLGKDFTNQAIPIRKANTTPPPKKQLERPPAAGVWVAGGSEVNELCSTTVAVKVAVDVGVASVRVWSGGGVSSVAVAVPAVAVTALVGMAVAVA